jgi:hypothetical protein
MGTLSNKKTIEQDVNIALVLFVSNSDNSFNYDAGQLEWGEI